MAVSKTPRKKPLTAAVEEDKSAPKAKAAPVKKAAPKKTQPAEPKAKASAKPREAKVAAAVKAEEPAAEPFLAVPTMPQPVVKQAPVTPALTPLAQTILTAICEGRAVEFIFADADANARAPSSPATHLRCPQPSLVRVGLGSPLQRERHHRVDLLAEVNAVDGVGRAAQGPYAEGTPANQIGGWLGVAHCREGHSDEAVGLRREAGATSLPELQDRRPGRWPGADLFHGHGSPRHRPLGHAVRRRRSGAGTGPACGSHQAGGGGLGWPGSPAGGCSATPKTSPRPEPTEPHRSESRHHRDREAKPEREARPPRESEREARPRGSQSGRMLLRKASLARSR